MKDELLYLIGLNLVPGIGPKLAKKLIVYCGGARAVFTESSQLLQKIPQVGAVLAKEITTQQVPIQCTFGCKVLYPKFGAKI